MLNRPGIEKLRALDQNFYVILQMQSFGRGPWAEAEYACGWKTVLLGEKNGTGQVWWHKSGFFFVSDRYWWKLNDSDKFSGKMSALEAQLLQLSKIALIGIWSLLFRHGTWIESSQGVGQSFEPSFKPPLVEGSQLFSGQMFGPLIRFRISLDPCGSKRLHCNHRRWWRIGISALEEVWERPVSHASIYEVFLEWKSRSQTLIKRFCPVVCSAIFYYKLAAK